MSPPALPLSAAAREAAIRSLWQVDKVSDARSPYLYVVLDAARDPGIYEGLRGLQRTIDIRPLYDGETARELAAVAPYLVAADRELILFDWLWREGWGRGWGIFIWSLATPDTLRSHLRRLTRVRTEKGGTLLFRFYDPEVLANVLPVLDARQLGEFFGPFNRILVEGEDGAVLSEFRFLEDRLRTRRLPLAG